MYALLSAASAHSLDGENTLPQEGAFKIKRGISDG